VVIQLVAQPSEVVSPPALVSFEPLEGLLVAAELSGPPGHVVVGVAGSGGAFGVAGQFVSEASALVASLPAQAGEPAEVVELAGSVFGDGVHVGQPRLGAVRLGDRGCQRLLAVRRSAR
jgi:hypothetical protein